MQTENHSNRASNHPGGNRRLWGILLAAVILLAGGFWARAVLLDRAKIPEVKPLGPREELPVPFITSDQFIVEKMVELADLTEDDLVYDLGCGDGRIVITAALRSGCRGVGFDIDPELVAVSRENARNQGVEDRVTFEEQDVFELDLSEADVAMAYLLPWMLEKMRPQFLKMNPGARIVLHDYWIEGVEPDQYVEIDPEGNGREIHGIYVYVLPLKLNPNMERLKPPRPRNWKRDREPIRPGVPAGSETQE